MAEALCMFKVARASRACIRQHLSTIRVWCKGRPAVETGGHARVRCGCARAGERHSHIRPASIGIRLDPRLTPQLTKSLPSYLSYILQDPYRTDFKNRDRSSA